MHVTCMLNVCQMCFECGSDACVIELVTGLYRSCKRRFTRPSLLTRRSVLAVTRVENDKMRRQL